MAGELLDPTVAATSPRPAHTPKYSRLTRSDLGVLLKLKRDGLTQAEIAQRLGCSQPTVSKWLDQFEDTTEHAKVFLRGSALRMAENVVKKGKARDHIQALKGIGVLEPDARDINIAVGVSLPGLSLVSVTETAPAYLSPSDIGDNS